jgi:hypothetical protein
MLGAGWVINMLVAEWAIRRGQVAKTVRRSAVEAASAHATVAA